MEMNEETKQGMTDEVKGLMIGGIATALVVAAGAAALLLLGTNIKSSGLTGDKGIHPTDDSTTASKAEVAASEKEGKLSQDTVSAQNGDLGASKTDAAAQNGEAKAADSGASALRTKAGASDIETKALKMT